MEKMPRRSGNLLLFSRVALALAHVDWVAFDALT